MLLAVSSLQYETSQYETSSSWHSWQAVARLSSSQVWPHQLPILFFLLQSPTGLANIIPSPSSHLLAQLKESRPPLVGEWKLRAFGRGKAFQNFFGGRNSPTPEICQLLATCRNMSQHFGLGICCGIIMLECQMAAAQSVETI